MNGDRCVRIEAPAKVNLGLEVLGKRPDGLHEVRTVMTTLELSDTVRVSVGGTRTGTDLPGLPAPGNLVARALTAFRAEVPHAPALGWSIEKRIPAAAGLGGASSDAAATLLAANALCGRPLDRIALARIAASLGSDVPFFLGSPVALASGRGTDLTPLPPIEEPVALLVPRIAIANKTRTLYGLLTEEDFSDGTRAGRVRTAIELRTLPAADDLGNAFARPLRELTPDIQRLHQEGEALGVRHIAVSGAGPAHYVIGRAACAALAWSTLVESWRGRVDVIWTRTRSTTLRTEACGDG